MLKGIVSGEEKDIIRIPMLVGDEYKEGWEVRDNQNRLIWGREDEFQTTADTLKLKGYGLPMKVKSLLGNAVQDGTPSPDAPIEPEFCGERTANLWNGVEYIKTSLSSSETWTYSEDLAGSVYRIPCKPNTTYTLYLTENISLTLWRIRDVSTDAVPTAQSTSVQIAASHAESVPSGNSTTFTTSQNAKYILFQTNASLYSSVLNCIMLVEGSTAISYEPYGWKIPFENHGENLFDISSVIYGTWTNDSGVVQLYGYGARSVDIPPNQITVSFNGSVFPFSYSIVWVDSGEEFIIRNHIGSATQIRKPQTFTPPSNAAKFYIQLSNGTDATHPITKEQIESYKLMLNAGSTALPYSPYINETTPVYLGQTQTVRKIRKLVLTGEEHDWINAAVITATNAYQNATAIAGYKREAFYCSHMVATTSSESATTHGYIGQRLTLCMDKTLGLDTVDKFKSYLANQYAAGTPVTVWYVLKEPETAIVNEPLAKIGDYADELTTIKVNNLSSPLYGIGDYKDTLNLSTGVITRRIKKLVLRGDEIAISKRTSPENSYSISIDRNSWPASTIGYGLSSHFVRNGTVANLINREFYVGSTAFSFRFDDCTDAAAFKSYLAAQYAAGTPVTVWYVLSEPKTETVSVPTGMTGEIEGYLTQISTPTPEHPSIPKWNGEEETGGTYAVAVYTPPEIPTTTGQNTLTVDTDLAPSSLTIKGHIKEWQPENLLPVSKFEDLSDPSYWSGGYNIRYNNMPAGTYVMSTNMPEKDPGDVYFNGENRLNVPYEGRPVSITINEGDSFYVLFFVDRGGYEKILDGTFVITLVKSE